jgi:large subunit ribosomal protein L25
VRLNGIAIGVKSEGGVLDFSHREIEVECLPSIIPGHIEVDVTNLKVGDSIRFDQLSLMPNVVLTGDAHQVVCAVRGKSAEEEAAAAPAATEPEVVKKGKKEDKK